MEELHEVGPN